MIFHIYKRKRRFAGVFLFCFGDYKALIASTGGFFAASKTGKKVATKLKTMLIPKMIKILSGPNSRSGMPMAECIISLLTNMQTMKLAIVDKKKQMAAMIPLSE